MEPQLCTACERNPVSIVDEERFSPITYHLCGFCFERLKERALRPMEYFRLRRLHGPAYDVGTDFYSDEGEALSPYMDVGLMPELAFPTLESLKDDVEGLIDYALVKWRFPLESIPFFEKHDEKALLSALDSRMESSAHLEGRLMEIGAEVLREKAYGWVRYQLGNRAEDAVLEHSKAVALTYPPQEGLELLKSKVEALDERRLRDAVVELAYYGGPEVINWLDALGGKLTRIHPNFGYVLAASEPEWSLIQLWLKRGGAWGRMALDALLELAQPENSPTRSDWFRRVSPRLQDVPEKEVIQATLETYLQLDTASMSRGKASAILAGYGHFRADS